MIQFWRCCDGQSHLCGGWICQQQAINLGGISLVPAAATGQGPYKRQQQCELDTSQFLKEDLSLSTPQTSHAVAKVGSCLVVAGGYCYNHGSWTNTFLEVLDIQQAIVWSLPNLTIRRPYGCSIVTLSDCLLVLGGNDSEDCVESLALTVSRKHECCFKFLKSLFEIEFLSQPTRK